MRREKIKTEFSAFFFTAAILAGAFFVFPAVCRAEAVNLGLTPQVEGALGLGTADIRITAARIIRNFFGLLGIVAVVIILYGGFLWMTSQGEEAQIDKAKKVIINGVIGLAIMLMAVAITQFIITRLLYATGAYGGPGGPPGAGYIPKSGSLGQGIIESHYPERGETGVPRNARIVITFKQEMDLGSFIRGFDYNDPASSTKHDLEDQNIKIFPQKDGPASAFKTTEVQVYYTADHKTFVFRVPLLGSPTLDVPYLVSLQGGPFGIHKIEGGKRAPAFEGAFASGYEWDFTTGTFIDTTPPKVESVVPFADTTNPRNTLIQVNFDEPVDPTTVSGQLPGFTNLSVLSGKVAVAGSFAVGNRYRTIEFTSTDLCGTNSCGGDVYCLPGESAIAVRVRSATLGTDPPLSDPTKVPSDGVTDMVGNSLDGNANGTAEGPGDPPQKDDYTWNFKTDNSIDLTPPVIENMSPGKDAPRVLPDKPVTAVFSKIMSLLSFNSAAVTLGTLSTKQIPPEPTCYTLSGSNLDAMGNIATSTPAIKSEMKMSHCLFYPDTNYIPNVSSRVKDIRQNCYLPGASASLLSCSATVMKSGGYYYCCNGKTCRQA